MHYGLRLFVSAAAILAAVAGFGCAQRPSGTAAAAEPAVRTGRLARELRQHAAPPRSVPEHVQTADYLWTPSERAADPRTYAPYLTFAYPLYSEFGRVARAGIQTVLYVNPLMPEPKERFEFPMVVRHPGLQAKDCSGNPVRAYGGTSYLLNVRSSRAAGAVRKIVDGYVGMVERENPQAGKPVDVLFVDNANSFYGVSPMPCGFNQAQWTAGVEAALSRTGYPVVINTLSVRPWIVPAKVAALHGPTIVGEMYEACFTDTQWSAEEIAQILTLRTLRRLHKPAGPGFWCYVNGKPTLSQAQSVTAQRLFEYASFLLTYDIRYSVYQTAYPSLPSTFKVLPETQFVPLDPLLHPRSVDDLRAAGGAYVQVFRYCYYRRKPLGACEVAVNPGNGTVELPNYGSFRHSARLSGAGVLDGGRMSFDAPAPEDLGSGSAAILVR